MRRTTIFLGLAVLLLALLVLVRSNRALAGRPAGPAARPAEVQVAAYDPISWWTVDGGGYSFSSGGRYSLGGTAGQPDAGVHSGGRYDLNGGYWDGLAKVLHRIYLPLVTKNYQ